jgi:hypothetical protein
MYFVIETQLPDYEEWYPVIDVDNSRLQPIVKKFQTREQAEAWAEKHSVSNHKWRVVEHVSE